MIDLGSIAGIPVGLFLACLLKCAVEVGNAEEHPDEVQNLLYLQCVADCLLPSGLPDPDRYKENREQKDNLPDQTDSEGTDFDFPDKEGPSGNKTPTIISLGANDVEIHTEYRRKVSIITIEDKDRAKKLQNKDFEDIYRPSEDLIPQIEELSHDILGKEVDVSTDAFSVSIIVPEIRREAISAFREQVIEILRNKDNH